MRYNVQLNRRDFLKLSAPAIALPVISGVSERGLTETYPHSPKSGEKALLYDVSKCVGCQLCVEACAKKNGLSFTEVKSQWLVEEGYGVFYKHQCMHCTDASCVEVCPTGAVAHHGEFVEVNQEWCIGCGYCVEACPFGAIHREPPKGTARKCTGCIDRVENGLEPACVEVCPYGALQFGERANLIETAHKRVQTLIAEGYPNANLYGENELDGLGVLFVLTERPSAFNLPENPKVATSRVPTQWFSGVGTAALLAGVFFWLLSRRKRRIEAIQQSKTEGGAEE